MQESQNRNGDVGVDFETSSRLNRFRKLFGEWNAYAGLMSPRDAENRWDEHVADSLSLLPLIRHHFEPGGSLLDVGSGGGFPAIPLAVALPDLNVCMIEKSAKKVGFLRVATSTLELRNCDVVHGVFPGACMGLSPSWITARAVDNPWKTFRNILEYLPKDCIFLNQLSVDTSGLSDRFHVEHLGQATSTAGMARGQTTIIRRVAGE